jgi:hypothetical protein
MKTLSFIFLQSLVSSNMVEPTPKVLHPSCQLSEVQFENAELSLVPLTLSERESVYKVLETKGYVFTESHNDLRIEISYLKNPVTHPGENGTYEYIRLFDGDDFFYKSFPQKISDSLDMELNFSLFSKTLASVPNCELESP